MANKLCTVCAKYNECTWMQVKALNSSTTDLGSFFRHDDWMGTYCKHFVYDENKGDNS